MDYSEYSKKLVEVLNLENPPIAITFLKPAKRLLPGLKCQLIKSVSVRP
jgi:uncharacterized protein (DUF169 family)